MSEAVERDRRSDALWRDRDFRRLWIGYTASQLGTQSSQLTLPLVAVVALGVEADQVGLLRAVQQVPILLFSLFVGAWVDRWRRRNVLVAADLARAITLAAVPAAYLLGVLGVAPLYVVGFLVGVFSVFFDVAYQAYLLRLVDRDRLMRANSVLEGSRSAAQMGGPALGGGLVSLLTAPVAVLASALFYLVSILSIMRIRRPEPEPEPVDRGVGLLGQVRAGLGVVARDPSLRAIAVVSGSYNVGFAAFITVYLLYLPRELNLSGAAVGLCMAALGPGALVGSLLAVRLPARWGYGVVVVAAAVIGDGVLLTVGALRGSGPGTVAQLVAVNLVFGAFTQTVNVVVNTIRQAVTPDDFQGRVAATIRFGGLGLTPLGSLLGGYLGQHLDLRPSVLLTAAALCLGPVLMVRSPLARIGRDLPAPIRR
ncbi:MAG: MFS transporter [Labedaea sp.]